MTVRVEYTGKTKWDEKSWIVVAEAGSIAERVVSGHHTRNAAIRKAREVADAGERIEAETKSGTTSVLVTGEGNPDPWGWEPSAPGPTGHYNGYRDLEGDI